jgi:hypothetical protein
MTDVTHRLESPLACGGGLHCYNACVVYGEGLDSNDFHTLWFGPADIMGSEVGAPTVLTGEGVYDAI